MTATASRTARTAKAVQYKSTSFIVVVISLFKEIKILRNSEARAHKDLDRLQKAQVMYTFATPNGASMYGRAGAQAHRKSREKLIQKEDAAQLQQQQNGNGNGMMTRRSARANNIKLERKLKRQRSEAGGSVTLPRTRMPRKEGTPKKRVEASQAGA
ncbi:hypothetical protein JOM56_011024 [Amanita muscaria]